jgi:DegV family protein with EDD domain
MAKVALITDSTATIPKDLLERYAICVAPQVLIWGDQELLDGIDIQPGEFYDRLQKSSTSPTTSQATPATFKKLYEELLEKEHEILAVVISAKLSGTMESARQAKEFFPDAPIELVDSQSAAMAEGFQVLAAARAAEQGASLAECKAVAEQARENSGVIFAVETLEFLHRGGRIGGGSRFLGTALNIKPILEVQEGRVEAVERIRTRKKSLNRLVDLVEERIKGRQPVRLAGLHANSPEDARWLLEEAGRRLNPTESLFTEVSPVIGTHAGPGTVGLAYMAGM